MSQRTHVLVLAALKAETKEIRATPAEPKQPFTAIQRNK